MFEFKDRIIEDIGEKRYQHSLRVLDEAESLASHYGLDIEKARKAAYFHDCAKIKDRQLLLKRASSFGIIDEMVLRENSELIHGRLGALFAREYYGIEDKSILDAIEYHTTGRANMTSLDKIVYLADYIEPMRNFPGVDRVRDLAYLNLDQAILKAMDQTIEFLIAKNLMISSLTIEARNDLLLKLKNMEG